MAVLHQFAGRDVVPLNSWSSNPSSRSHKSPVNLNYEPTLAAHNSGLCVRWSGTFSPYDTRDQALALLMVARQSSFAAAVGGSCVGGGSDRQGKARATRRWCHRGVPGTKSPAASQSAAACSTRLSETTGDIECASRQPLPPVAVPPGSTLPSPLDRAASFARPPKLGRRRKLERRLRRSPGNSDAPSHGAF